MGFYWAFDWQIGWIGIGEREERVLEVLWVDVGFGDWALGIGVSRVLGED